MPPSMPLLQAPVLQPDLAAQRQLALPHLHMLAPQDTAAVGAPARAQPMKAEAAATQQRSPNQVHSRMKTMSRWCHCVRLQCSLTIGATSGSLSLM